MPDDVSESKAIRRLLSEADVMRTGSTSRATNCSVRTANSSAEHGWVKGSVFCSIHKISTIHKNKVSSVEQASKHLANPTNLFLLVVLFRPAIQRAAGGDGGVAFLCFLADGSVGDPGAGRAG